MDNERAIRILDVNAICSPNATEFRKAVEVAKRAIEKRIPEKPVANGVIHHCPDCNNVVVDMFKHPFCDECGKALDWSGIGEGGEEE